MRNVLIICTGNSCRSQMAEGLVNHFLRHKWRAFSAGIKPSKVNPRAVQVMAELGIDISQNRSKSVDEFLRREDIDLVFTVCDSAKESCPIFFNPVKQVHISFEDPAPYTEEADEIALPKFREIRDKIREELLDFLNQQ